jgi:hypothetical protein
MNGAKYANKKIYSDVTNDIIFHLKFIVRGINKYVRKNITTDEIPIIKISRNIIILLNRNSEILFLLKNSIINTISLVPKIEYIIPAKIIINNGLNNPISVNLK